MRISDWSSDVCSSDLMIGDVQTFALGITGHAQAEHGVDDGEGDRRPDGGPNNGNQHGPNLNHELSSDDEILRSETAQRGRRDDAGADGADDAADAMNPEHVKRIVQLEPVLEAADEAVAGERSDEPEKDRDRKSTRLNSSH